jgi:hypothetical protein
MQSEYQARKEMFKKSFIDFKNRIDADPYGALFGRKLQRLCWHPKRDGWPGSSWLLNKRVEPLKGRAADRYPEVFKNRSNESVTEDWDSGFWEIVPERSKEKKPPNDDKPTSLPSSEKLANPPKTERGEAPIPKRTEAIPSLQSTAAEEFEFDPISMRKVPKKPVAPATSNAQSKPFLDEPIDIPVKTFKGYRSQFRGIQPPKKPEGPHKDEAPSRTPPPSVTEITTEPFPSDMAFHTSIPKVINLDPPSPNNSRDWLSKEGFGSKPQQSFREEPKSSPLPKFSVDSSTTRTGKMEKIESSVDRIQAAFDASVNRIRPAFKSSAGRGQADLNATDGEKAQNAPNYEADSEVEYLTHLRASDIRSSPKFARSSETPLDLLRHNLREKGSERKEYVQETEDETFKAAESGKLPKLPRTEHGTAKAAENIKLQNLARRIDDIYRSSSSSHSRPDLTCQTENAEVRRQVLEREAVLSASRRTELESILEAAQSENTAAISDKKPELLDRIHDAENRLRKIGRSGIYLAFAFLDYARWQRVAVSSKEVEAANSKSAKETQLDAVLSKEVDAQKTAMVAAETRGSRKIVKDPKPMNFFQANNYAPGPITGFARSVLEHEKRAREIKEAEKAKERALVREIRSIYEDKYGTLDSKHRQPPPASEEMVPIMPKESKISLPPKEQYRGLVQEIRSIYEDSYGKLDSNHRQPGEEPVVTATEPPQMPLAPEQISKVDAPTTIPPTTAALPEEPHVTPPEVEAQIVKEIQDDTDIKRKDRVLADLKASADLKQELQATRTLLDEAKAQLKLAELTSGSTKDQRLPPPPTPIITSPSPPSIYKILAYDSSALQVTMAETTSSILSPNESPLSPAEALSRLNNAAKFLPHFSALQNAGYEIVSGTGDLLIFKKVRDVVADEPEAASLATNLPPWEIELQEAQSPSPAPAPSNSPTKSGSSTKTIKRTEPVFSGQSANTASSALSGSGSSSSESGPKAKSKRSKMSLIFWGALWTGASATAYSVVRNFFREGNAEEREVDWLGGTRKQR